MASKSEVSNVGASALPSKDNVEKIDNDGSPPAPAGSTKSKSKAKKKPEAKPAEKPAKKKVGPGSAGISALKEALAKAQEAEEALDRAEKEKEKQEQELRDRVKEQERLEKEKKGEEEAKGEGTYCSTQGRRKI